MSNNSKQQTTKKVQRWKLGWLFGSMLVAVVCNSPLASAFQPLLPSASSSSSSRHQSTHLFAEDVQKKKKQVIISPARHQNTAANSNGYQSPRPSNARRSQPPAVSFNNTTTKNQTHPSIDDIDEHFAAKLAEMHDRNSRGANLTQSYCDSVLGLCVAADAWDSVLEVLAVMKSHGLSQERSTYRASLQVCFEYGNGAAAQEILRAMQTALFEPGPTDISLVVAAMCRQNMRDDRWWRRALNLLKATDAGDSDKKVPVEAYDAVLTCMVKARSWKDAVRLLQLMEQEDSHHPAPNLSTYRLAIETCVAAKQTEQAFSILMGMSKRGLTPTAYTFELIISALAQKLQWRRALQLLDMMDDMGVQKTVIVYNTVISACAKSGEVASAKNLLRNMRKSGVKPDIFSFNSVMTACASTSRWKDALNVLDQCHREPGVDPDIITYTNAIRACTRGRETSRALSILQVIKDKKLPLDNYAYVAAIDACAKGRMWQRALELLQEMEDNGVSPNAIAYSVTITACGNGGQWEKSLELLNEMKEKKMRINLITYNSAITALSKASRRSARRSTKEHAPMRFSKEVTVTEVLDVDEQQLWTYALDILKMIRKDGMEPDGFSFSAAISCCGNGGRWEEALSLIKTMQRGGPKSRPNKIAYTAAISACGRSGKADEALKLFTDMKEQGLQPDRVAYNAVISALRVAHMPEKVLVLWREMVGKRNVRSSRMPSARAPPSLSPDIVTVTDVLATLTRSGGAFMNDVDQIFAEAVKRGIVLGGLLDSHYEVDLSGMTFPVARAAVRFIFKRIKDNSERGEKVEGVVLITGIGSQFMRPASQEAPSMERPDAGLSLREYVQDVLSEDFDPPIKSFVPSLGQGTIEVAVKDVAGWAGAKTAQLKN